MSRPPIDETRMPLDPVRKASNQSIAAASARVGDSVINQLDGLYELSLTPRDSTMYAQACTLDKRTCVINYSTYFVYQTKKMTRHELVETGGWVIPG